VTSIPALATTVTSLVDAVDASLVTLIVLLVSREMLPSDKVRAGLVTLTEATPVIVTDAVLAVTELPATGQIQALPVTTTVPTAEVAALPVAATVAAALGVTEAVLTVAALPVRATVTSTTPPHVDDP
tara:strand:- start:375 stop:758 length:384 start_codon:yes stop_codon:yes gene_type:complete